MAYLDLSNAIARSGRLSSHPFDSDAGFAMLAAWLSDPDEERYSYGHSAAASIPFLSPERRGKVLELADRHPDRAVQLEAAWAAAACGEARGYQTLQAACADPRYASSAMEYLRELGAEDRIPLHTGSEDFQAIAEMCDWLSHPMEFGRAPADIRQVDTRELFWPPTNDRRQLWVFRYEYPPRDGEKDPDVGYRMDGSVALRLVRRIDSEPFGRAGLRPPLRLGAGEQSRSAGSQEADGRSGVGDPARVQPWSCEGLMTRHPRGWPSVAKCGIQSLGFGPSRRRSIDGRA